MRVDTATFAAKNVALVKRPRYVIELAFDSDNTTLWYFTSHDDAALPGGASSIVGVVEGLSGTSQTLNPDAANASIGNISFSVVDKASVVTNTLGTQLVLGRSTRRQRVRVYIGFEGMAWADYTLVQTQLVSEITYNDGTYKFTCADIQREMRKDIFELGKTTLAAVLSETATVIDVVSTTAFAMIAHGTSYSDAPSATVGYVKVQDEVIRYTGKSATQFTGCTRGALNTRAVEHAVDLTAAADRRTAVEEYVYLEMPAVKLMYGLLTGNFPDLPISDTITSAYDSSLWIAGVTPTSYSLNENVAGESVFAVRTGPFGTQEVVNVCINKDTFAGEPGSDGGWNTAVTIAVDSTKSHLFAVWMKRKVTGGTAYWGMKSNGTTDAVVVSGGDGGNPYFEALAPATLMPNNDEWYLVVGFMHANGYAGGDLGISGVYNSVGVKIVDGIEFAWANTTTLCAHRAYHYYNSTDPVDTECQQMARPRIWPCAAADAAALISSICNSAARLPTAWHLGIPTSYVRLSDFSGIGADIWDTSDDVQGFNVRLEGMGKADGKKFIETELALLTGVFMPVYADGALGLRRMANVLAGSSYVAHLDESNVVSAGNLVHDFDALRNVLQVSWNWEPAREEFTRINLLIDASSVTIHGKADPLKLKFRGLHGSRHSSTMLARRFDALRDRYTGPPQRIEVKVLPSLNTLEVGDVVRLRLHVTRDFVVNATLDRSFEIQNITTDWVTGNLSLRLFGSSQAPGAIAPSADSVVLSNAWYVSQGTALSSVVTITGSAPGHVTAGGTLTGNVDMNAAGAIYYYDGDLIIDAGVTLTIENNVQLRVKGFLTNNGTINGIGGGHSGAVSVTPSDRWTVPRGVSGFLASTQAGDGIATGLFYRESPVAGAIGGWQAIGIPGARAFGLYQVMPSFNITWNGSVLSGVPSDLRGTSGSVGATSAFGGGWPHLPDGTPGVYPLTFYAGGNGGDGGAGLVIVSRGFAQGVSAKIDTSGAPGLAGVRITPNPPNDRSFRSGSGAGGAPGGLLLLLDGASASATGLTEAGFVALQGKTPIASALIPNGEAVEPGYDVSMSPGGTGDGSTFPLPGTRPGDYLAFHRVQYIPNNGEVEADQLAATLSAPTNLGLASGTAELLVSSDGTVVPRIKVTWTPSVDARVIGYEIQFKLSSESIWSNTSLVLGQLSSTAWIIGVRDGVNYDVRIHAVGVVREVSDWVTITGYSVIGKTAAPSTVGALIFADPFLSWVAITDVDRRGYIVRYQVGANNDWVSAIPAHKEGFITETRFDTSAIVGGSTTMLVKSVDTSGNESAAASTLLVDLRPAVPTSFTISRQPDGTREFSWTFNSPPTDLAGYRLRYFLGTTSDWAAMTPLHTGLLVSSPYETNLLAAGTYTFAIKSVDLSGNESATELFITTVTIGDPRIPGVIEDLKEEPGWVGTKSGCVVDVATGWLIATDTTTWAGLPATWDAWTSWTMAPTSPITYTREIDIGVKVKFIPLVTVLSDGAQTIEEQHGDDGIAWSSYAVLGPLVDARYIRIRVTVAGSFPKLKTERIILSASPIDEIIEDQDSSTLAGAYRIGVGDVRVPIVKVYTTIKKVDITLQSVGAGWSWELIDKDVAVGPRIKIYNASDAAADAVFDATVIGI